MNKFIPEIKYGQYIAATFNKLDFDFRAGKKILDVGCGDGIYSQVFSNELGMDVVGVDIFRHENLKPHASKFVLGSIYDLPFKSNHFQYVFIHDVLHHIDEEGQRFEYHIRGLQELLRVACGGGSIIIVEGNRYNPLFYPHMVKIHGHRHWRQSYFQRCIDTAFLAHEISYSYFEAHAYPWAVGFFKLYEHFMERFSPQQFLAYNVAIVTK